jgi:hypothetical protein
MNNYKSPLAKRILPLFLISGLLTTSAGLLSGCSSTRPDAATAPDANAPTEQETAPVTTGKADQKHEIRVKKEYPRIYTVKKGDTLWDIASMYLHDPWYWPEIWSRNQQIKNPHLIYPGDVLTLIYVNGQPQIRLNEEKHKELESKAEGGLPVKKLSPHIRESSLDASIATIPGDAIRQFLTKPRVVTKQQMEDAPYIVGSEDTHLVLGQGDRVYVRGEIDKERVRYSVFTPGDELRDPETDELLGYEAKYSGELRIVKYADPASADLTFTEREVLIGDRLLPEDKSKVDNLYFPRVPDIKINGQIISLYDALFGVAQYQIVVINKGELDGLEVGNLLATYTLGATVRDHNDKRHSEPVKLPDERSGLVMIFKTFERVSYGLVLESTRVIHKLDKIETPRL